MLQFSLQALNSIFSHLSFLEDKVIWIRNIQLTQQYFVSPSYEKIWGQSIEQLYHNPLTWNDFLINDNICHSLTNLTKRNSELNDKKHAQMYYRIHNKKQQQLFLKDESFLLFNKEQPFAVTGISEIITEQQWIKEQQNNDKEEKNINMIKDIGHIFKMEYGVFLKESIEPQPSLPKSFYINCAYKKIQLAPREAQCLKHLIMGHSAKETANALNLSQRTVENYLDTLKRKTQCRKKYELLSKIDLQDFLHRYKNQI